MTMGDDMHFTLHARQVLVAAVPNDSQATELVTALRAIELDVVVAETLELATQADEFGACIVLLRPGVWRSTPVIATVIRSNPRYLIPVLAEPMSLPPGSWSTEPLLLKRPVSQTARELAPHISSAFERSTATSSATGQHTIRDAEPGLSIGSMRPLRLSVRPHFPVSRNALLIVVILLLGLGLLYLISTSPSSRVSSPIRAVPTSNPLLDRTYTANVPGPGCDAGGADWGVGTYFKGLITPTAQNGTIPPGGMTPTSQVMIDPSIETTCRSDGLLVTRKANFDTYASTFFASGVGALPSHFKTQITATMVSTSSTAQFDLGVRSQGSAPNSRGNGDNGYGDDTLVVSVDGLWKTQRVNNSTGTFDAPFTQGFVQPARTFILAAEVDGARITYMINGRIVTTIVDPTYPNSYGIDFGLVDSDTHTPTSTLYSHFFYAPLPDTHLTFNSAVATATSQAIKTLHTPYIASIPGFGCDKGVGQWEPIAEANDKVTVRCLANGLLISQGASAKYFGHVAFYGLDGNFPASYTVKTHINVGVLNEGCVGITTHADSLAAYYMGYTFLVCSDGSWQILRFDSSGGGGHILVQGHVTPQSSYTLEATSSDGTQALSLNGTQVASVKDVTLKATEHIDLVLSVPPGATGSAIFSQFVFTPLS